MFFIILFIIYALVHVVILFMTFTSAILVNNDGYMKPFRFLLILLCAAILVALNTTFAIQWWKNKTPPPKYEQIQEPLYRKL